MAKANTAAKYKRPHKLKYGKWGIIFILPFFITYAVFQLYPLIMTFYKSFFEEKIILRKTDMHIWICLIW